MKNQWSATGNPINRSLIYILLSSVVLISLILVVSGLAILIENTRLTSRPLWIILVAVIVMIVITPLRHILQKKIGRAFFEHQNIQREGALEFGQELTRIIDLPGTITRLHYHIASGLDPSALHIFVLDPIIEQYQAAVDESGEQTSDLRFPSSSSLVQAFRKFVGPVSIQNPEFQKQISHSDKSRLAILRAQVLVPLKGDKQLAGWIAIGAGRSQIPYKKSDLMYLESLCQLAAIAIERAQIIIRLEQRVREMDVLSRVAQGVNITPAFDDILELVYTQASQVIACDDFHITLRNTVSDLYYHAFYLENNERLPSRENSTLPPGLGLETEVIRSQHPLQTDDYHQECLARQVQPDSRGIYAWISVPLNAGADTIGAISLGTRDPMRVYTNKQLGLFQSIADQAAGAIIKTRLISETEQRARQLNMLNEISRSLTSTLEINPLLNQILKSATEILNCEAGSLFMIDEPSGELVFEVTAGPVADNLVGTRLPPGTGIVGRSVESETPVIANDVQQFSNWSDLTDKQTGFITRDLMVVPMQVKEKIIGVIEIINKKDGSPFTTDDQELLSTFASQAAIAIDNARLYTQTDQALSARVEELSVMQRIDRELNASLELVRVLRIALDWSMRQSHADVGLVGLVDWDENGEAWSIRVVASQGIHNNSIEVNQTQMGYSLTSDLTNSPSIRKAFQQMAPERTQSLKLAETGSQSRDATQIIVPIHRKNDPIGVILLESTQRDTFKDETISFLSRLSDHSAIAISNAQLYADLQSANIAKTEFISLVSHELKTPMTSIKGYADLLAKGAVGPINDVQGNFLNTIRSNVNRMTTLVSDLSDISRIEAGRMRLEYSLVSINEVIHEVVRSAQAQIDEKRQLLESTLPEDNPRVWGDNTRLTQILANLISNASKYTPNEGSIIISARKEQNQWDPKGAPEVVCVRVADTGYGISSKDQENIFQKFFRSEDQNIRESPGTGLGLNITRHLVEMQGGRIWFESQLGKGTSFYFTIPLSSTTQ